MKHHKRMTFSLLSISLVLTSATSISSTIPLMHSTFNQQPLALIEMVSVLPSLTCLILVLLSSSISKKIGSKQTVLLGLFICALCGSMPMYINNFYMILLSRIGLGVGLGLFNSLAISLISDFYEGDKRTRLIGYQSAFQGLGGAFLTFVAGQLLNINWHLSFSIYLLAIPIFILFALFVPQSNKATSMIKKPINRSIWKYIVCLFFTMILYNAVYLKIPSLFIDKAIGNATSASILLSIAQIGGTITGFLFGSIYKKAKQNTLVYAFALMTISYLLIAFTHSLVLVGISTVLAGIAFSLFVPYIFNRTSELSLPESQAEVSSKLIVSAQCAGLISPYCFAFIGQFSFLPNESEFIFLFGAIYFILLTLFIVLKSSRVK